jgi:hypothetical protein
MIPWNYRDPENITHEPDLRQGLRSSLRHMLERVSPAVRIAVDGIPSLETFGNILPTIASNGLKKYLQQAPVSPTDSPLSENPHFRMDTPDVERHDE